MPGGLAAETARLTGGAAFIRVVASYGAKRVFGRASGKPGPVFRAIADTPELDCLGVRHEASAAFMATAIAARSDEIALCMGKTWES